MKKNLVKLSVVLTLLCATTFGSCQTPEIVDVKPFNYSWVDSEEPYHEEGSKEYMLEYYEGLTYEENFQPIMDTAYTLIVEKDAAKVFYDIVDKYHKELMEVTDEYFDEVQNKYRYIIDTTFIIVRYSNGETKLQLNK